MLPNLKHILQYTHPGVIARYTHDYPNNQLAGKEALTQLIQYLWLSKKHQFEQLKNPTSKALQFECLMHPEMHEIDDMWHTFLLFTKDYSDFCQQYFDAFVHHSPIVDNEISHSENEIECARYLSYIYDHLGEETLCTWFSSYTKA